MALAPAKQTIYAQTPLLATGKQVLLLPEHTRPYLKRHLIFLLAAIIFSAALCIELAAITMRQTLDPRALLAISQPAQLDSNRTLQTKHYGLIYDSDMVTATSNGQQVITSNKDTPLAEVSFTPLASTGGEFAATSLRVLSDTDPPAFAAFKASFKSRTDIETITAAYYAVKESDIARVSEDSRTTESIQGQFFTKTVYTVTPKYAGNPTKSIVWSANKSGQPLALQLHGVRQPIIPKIYERIFASIRFDGAQVQGIFDTKEDLPAPTQRFIADLASPAVVKIYHIVCGSLTYQGQVITDDSCHASSGSGFFVSSDGMIATNGHVVVYDARDIMAKALLADAQLFSQYLAFNQYTSTQISEVIARPELTASIIAKIYDLPNEQLGLQNQRELTVVALADKPLSLQNKDDVKNLMTTFTPSYDLKQATVIAHDYNPKDQVTLIANQQAGFSASDVALLKVGMTDTPFISISDQFVTQNQAVTIVGFPSDADNRLTDNRSIQVSTTNGVISAIRQAAGGSGTLYQSDADASHGSSGGPVINENGQVLGLLTYRFASGNSGDAPKSYIRDIGDFTKLMKSQDVNLAQAGLTQSSWLKGLSLFSRSHYSAAKAEFERVQRIYPAHRLASTYIDESNRAIAAGKDVKQTSTTLIALATGGGLGAIAIAIFMIARHHGRHQVYRTYHQHRPKVRHAQAA